MKKFLLVAFVAIATIVTSCKKDENNPLEGTWQIESKTFDGKAMELDECGKKETIVFTNGAFVIIAYIIASNGECESKGEAKGTYSINGDKITYMYEDRDSYTDTFNVSENTLTLTGIDKGAVFVEVYKRK